MQGKIERSEFSAGNLTKNNHLDAGLDIKAAQPVIVPAQSRAIVPTGIRIAVPEGCVGLIWSRSGLSANCGIEVGAGCIDASYRGELKVLLYNHSKTEYYVKKGDRIAQLLTVPVSLATYEEVDSLDDTNRGDGGFGSSGN